MKIERNLKIVIPVERENDTIYVHSEAISREVFQQYFVVIAKAFAGMYTSGMGHIAAPRVAAMMLQKTAEDMGVWNGSDGVQNGLMNEIRRLANVIMPVAGKGWEMVPLQEAVDRKFFDLDDLSEVENAMAFFIVASAMHKKKDLRGILGGMTGLWDVRIESLNCTEYTASLRMLTAAETTGETPPVSSVAY